MTYSVGDKVKWNSSNADKIGEIVAVVPATSDCFRPPNPPNEERRA